MMRALCAAHSHTHTHARTHASRLAAGATCDDAAPADRAGAAEMSRFFATGDTESSEEELDDDGRELREHRRPSAVYVRSRWAAGRPAAGG